MAQTKYTNGSGVSEMWLNIKNWVTSQLLGYSQTGHTHNASDITSGLSTVATSGSYTDLSNKPTIPTKTSDLTNDSGYITSSGSCNYANSAGYVQGNNNSANAANALLRSGGGRGDSSPEGDTWIFLDSIGGSGAPWGFKHNQAANTIGFYGAGTETSSINLSNGYFSGSCNYANSAGGVAWDNVSGKPSAFTPYFANGTWYAVGDDAAIGDHNVGGGLGVKALNSTTTRIDFCYKDDASNYKSITYDGTTLYMNGNCDYATNSGSSTYSTYLNSLGAQTPKSGRDIFHPGVYTYTTYTDTNTPAHYGAVIGYGNGQGGSCEMFAEWVGSGQLWFRVLRDCDDSWTNWQQIITSNNIGSQSVNYANSAGSSSIATRDSGGTWISGRDNAVVKQTRHSTDDGGSWNPAVSVKTKNGNWTIGTVGYDKLQFSYDTDEDYNTGNNRNTVVELNPEAGTIITSANIGAQSVNYANSAGSAGSVAWGNVSGRPWALSQFTNDSGFLTSADRLPIGSYIQFAGSQAPAGFLVCNGGAISRTTYSALFAVIGTTYGSGDGWSTFNLPNLTDRFLQGSTSVGTVKNAGLPNITGERTNFSMYGDNQGTTGALTVILPGGGALASNAGTNNCRKSTLSFNASNSNSIYGSSSTVQPPALTCLICIKY